jgi:hypothetical protein
MAGLSPQGDVHPPPLYQKTASYNKSGCRVALIWITLHVNKLVQYIINIFIIDVIIDLVIIITMIVMLKIHGM